jgi:hypothetical protein
VANRAAAEFLGVEPSPDPGVGHDLPVYAPDARLTVDGVASLSLGDWYAFGQQVIERLGHELSDDAVSTAQLWPEHFDLAAQVLATGGAGVNVGFSPGDEYLGQPYLYVGPHDLEGLSGDYWNAPFGAAVTRSRLVDTGAPVEIALRFVRSALSELSALP